MAQFAAPVTLNLNYAGLAVEPSAEETILYFFWDETAGRWRSIATTVIGPGQIYAYPEAINEIQMWLKEETNPDFELSRKYKLNYTYYTQDGTSTPQEVGPHHYHLMLSGITEVDKDNNVLPTTTLTYRPTGHLQVIDNNYGGKVGYEYEKVKSRDLGPGPTHEEADRWRVLTRLITATNETIAVFHYEYAPALKVVDEFRGHPVINVTQPEGIRVQYVYSLGGYEYDLVFGRPLDWQAKEPLWGRLLEITVFDQDDHPVSVVETEYDPVETIVGVHFVAPKK